MADRPILFSTEMVLALLREIGEAGSGKTQTRRVLKPQPPSQEQFRGSVFGMRPAVDDGVKMYSQNDYNRLPKHPTKWELIGSVGVARDAGFPKVYEVRYAVGDRLWVREAWRTNVGADELRPSELNRKVSIYYQADAADRGLPAQAGRLRASIHLPRAFSRITLQVTEVRVERLQAISEKDCIAEGIEPVGDGTFTIPGQYLYTDPMKLRTAISAISAYGSLWRRLNGEKSWDQDPWVAVYTFRPMLGNIDRLTESA